MPKLKSHKGLLKRVKISGTGKLLHARRGKSHLNSGLTSKRRRNLRRTGVASRAVAKRLERILHARLKGWEQG